MGRRSDRGCRLAGQWLDGGHSRLAQLVFRWRRRPRRCQRNIPAARPRLYDIAGVDLYAAGRRYLRLGDWRMVGTGQLPSFQGGQGWGTASQHRRRRALLDRLSRHGSPWFRRPAWDDLPVPGAMIEVTEMVDREGTQHSHTIKERSVIMSDASKQQDWTKPAPMAIPKGGFAEDKVEQGRYGPIFPQSPACYGFSMLAKIIPGREEVFYEYAKNIEKTVASQPDCLAVLKLHYLRWVLFPINGETYFMYQGIFDTDFDKYTDDAVALFSATGIDTVFENLEGFPKDWKTKPEDFVKFVREHQVPSFLEYGEYPYVSADEIKKALKLKAAFSNMLDQMQ